MNKRQIENIIWHIETNRKVLGDKRTLDDVLNSLKNSFKEFENVINNIEGNRTALGDKDSLNNVLNYLKTL